MYMEPQASSQIGINENQWIITAADLSHVCYLVAIINKTVGYTEIYLHFFLTLVTSLLIMC